MRANPADVCIIEDDTAQRALLFRRLIEQQFSVVEAEDAESGLRQIRQHHPRVVLCDLLLPGMSGTGLCREVRSDPALDGTYIIVLTMCESVDAKHEALNAGADDYLLKPYDPSELLARLRNGLRISHLQERLRRAALTDALTGLWNHAQFRELLDREFSRTRRYGGAASLLMLDLDLFKSVNDSFGHEVGNRVIEATARHLRQMVRETDIVARYGGEEFAVVCPATSLEDASQLAERIRVTLPDQVRVRGCEQLRLTASIGVAATTDPQAQTVTDLINLADSALYVGKHGGRNRVVRCDELKETPAAEVVDCNEVDRLRKQIHSLSMQAKELCLQSIWALVQALEARDPFTAWHSRNTMAYAQDMAVAAGLSKNMQEAIANAAMLHDLGKIGVPDQILQSVAPLTEAQTTIIRQVPQLTCRIIEPLRVFETETVIVCHLRERFDGSGYPNGLAGRAIPIGSRLLAVAETFDALTSARAHRPSRSMRAALRVIQAEAGRQFDPEYTTLLAQVLADHHESWRERIEQARVALSTVQGEFQPVLDTHSAAAARRRHEWN